MRITNHWRHAAIIPDTLDRNILNCIFVQFPVAKNATGCVSRLAWRIMAMSPVPRFASVQSQHPPHSLTAGSHRRHISQILLVVKKTTGGRAWLPKWGFSGLTKGQKVNKKQQREDEQAVVKALREAEQSEIQHKTQHQTSR